MPFIISDMPELRNALTEVPFVDKLHEVRSRNHGHLVQASITAGGSANMKYSYKNTLHACYTGYFTQAIVNNLAPLFFVIFQNRFGLSFEEVGRLILINFVVQIAADIFALKFMDSFGYRKAAVLAHFLCALGLVLLAVLPNVFPRHMWESWLPWSSMPAAAAFSKCWSVRL